MGKTGEVTTGESPTGDNAGTVLAAPVQNLTLQDPTATISGVLNTLSAPVQTLQLVAKTGPGDVNGKTGESKTGEAVTGGSGSTGTTITTLTVDLSAPVQTLALQDPTASITGAGTATINANEHVLQLAIPQALIGYKQWVINSQPLRVREVTLTPTELTLEVRARTSAERSLLDTLDANAGAYQDRQLADGTAQARDTSGGSNNFDPIPPIRMQPPRTTRTFFVDNVSRRRTSADTQGIIGTISLVAQDTRSAVTGYTDAVDSSKWEFDFNGGRIVTDRVSTIDQGPTTSVELILTESQAELFETLTAATAGAVVATVPDGESYSRDTTPNNRQTVTITPPSGAADPAIPQGDYVVENWESVGNDGFAFRVRMDISSRYDPK